MNHAQAMPRVDDAVAWRVGLPGRARARGRLRVRVGPRVRVSGRVRVGATQGSGSG